MLLAGGGVVVNPAKKKNKSRRGGRATQPEAAPSGGPSPGEPPKDGGQKQRVMPGAIWTREEAERKALEMGFAKTKLRSMNQVVYKKGRLYIARDRTGHTGGAWKLGYQPAKLHLRTARLGTYNKDLTQRVAD